MSLSPEVEARNKAASLQLAKEVANQKQAAAVAASAATRPVAVSHLSVVDEKLLLAQLPPFLHTLGRSGHLGSDVGSFCQRTLHVQTKVLHPSHRIAPPPFPVPQLLHACPPTLHDV